MRDMLKAASPSISRRDCIKLVGGTALAVGMGGLLGGCSSENGTDQEEPTTQDSTTLRVAMMGSTTDTLDPATFSTLLPLAIALNVYDSLILLRNGIVENQLAERIVPNEDATAWTVTLREGVYYHNGDPVTAEDALYSLQYAGTSPMYASFYSNVDWAGSTVEDERTFVLRLLSPQATFWDEVVSAVTFVFPKGSAGDDFSQDIGSGPFKLSSFSPDTGAVLLKNEEYWGGAPAIDTVEIIPITDPETRYAALTTGEVDYAHQISTTNAATLEGQTGFAVFNGGIENSSSFRFCLNASMAPFDDPDVRRAFKMVVDRQTMCDTIFRSAGVVGNDVLGQGMPGYNDSLEQRGYDFDEAKRILSEKGVAEISITTAETTTGVNDSAEMLAQKLEEAGVSVTIIEEDPTTLFSDMNTIYGAQVFATYLINRPYIASAVMYTGGSSPYNFSQWKDEEYDALLSQATSTVDEAERADILNQAQARLWAEGGDIVWGYCADLSGQVDTLDGIEITLSVPLFAHAAFSE
ncbi:MULTISPECIES: ABC transporter substrate-binding protein [Gordonibacter]|uniref:ABC transporter substrate-binding protein n=1 Tax=Gordonibacter faecis TaxID=3047475 RepID=A0ABT7DKL6_9ACTN|nr:MULTISPECIES: ABC transporter substrate-binding protein [unclassified Gordonibacter]MDJ1650063.1 ABC transporter substrate-binding protein [Gordonibacter sp. KGMB12511]